MTQAAPPESSRHSPPSAAGRCELEEIDSAIDDREFARAFGAPKIAPVELRRRRPSWGLIAGVAIVLVSIGIGMRNLAFERPPSPRIPSIPFQSTQISPLWFQFTVKQRGEILVLTWDRNAAAVRDASQAILSIRDGERQRDIALDLSVLRTRIAEYRPFSRNVEFQLTLTEPTGRRVSERAAAGLSAPPTELAPAEPIAQDAARSRERPDFVPPHSTRVASEIPEPPALGEPASLPGLMGAPVLRQPEIARAPAPEQLVRTEPAPPLRTPATAAAAGQISDPVLIRQTKPVYPQLAWQHRVQGSVSLKILVDTNGRVTKAEVLDGPPVLRQAALDAVRQWLYKPALLDGDPVSIALKVTVTFVASGREN